MTNSQTILRPRLMALAAGGLLAALTACGASATTTGLDSGASATMATTASSSSPGATPSSDAPSSAAASKAAAPARITIKDFKYTLPAEVPAGATITVTNQDSQNHTVTSSPKGAFEVKVDGGGGTATFTAPTKPGNYQIVCDFHANMMGILVVK